MSRSTQVARNLTGRARAVRGGGGARGTRRTPHVNEQWSTR
ncbi:hypothetical protein STRTUCAR8_10126 [Streptomyces turgidiscabies Car8]|uniref:Uncharacterized protein n=1 Tax=Streptomyces turgidiscabies (strain Car8) TaxID=698760 RepID=L7FGI6_STRT8|nr:hypothetical protein STRTUCAR8_10126 [Streptomyces turgidiscabies Car8]